MRFCPCPLHRPPTIQQCVLFASALIDAQFLALALTDRAELTAAATRLQQLVEAKSAFGHAAEPLLGQLPQLMQMCSQGHRAAVDAPGYCIELLHL